MDYLPNDPDMLVSAANMLLRDEEYEDLDDLCSAFDRNRDELETRLREHGFAYDAAQRQFRPI